MLENLKFEYFDFSIPLEWQSLLQTEKLWKSLSDASTCYIHKSSALLLIKKPSEWPWLPFLCVHRFKKKGWAVHRTWSDFNSPVMLTSCGKSIKTCLDPSSSTRWSEWSRVLGSLSLSCNLQKQSLKNFSDMIVFLHPAAFIKLPSYLAWATALAFW